MWHGVSWKLGATVAKGWFLFGVFPGLPPGTLGKYLFFSTVALFGGRIASMGMEEQLPLYVQGATDRMRKWLPLYFAVLILVIATAAILNCVPNIWMAVVMVMVTYAANNVLMGMVRSANPAAMEILASFHAILFPLLATLPIWIEARELLLFFAASLLCAQAVTIRLVGYSNFNRSHVMQKFPPVRSMMRAGLEKLVSNVALFVSMRGVILLPKALLGRVPSDSIAFGVALGEAAWQVGMILVNRSYARFCNADFKQHELIAELRIRVAVLCIVFLIAGAIGFIGIPALFWRSSVDWRQVGAVLAMYGPICGLLLIRYGHWALGLTGNNLLGLLGLWLLTQLCIVWFLPENTWAASITLGSLFLLAFSAQSFRRHLQYVSMR